MAYWSYIRMCRGVTWCGLSELYTAGYRPIYGWFWLCTLLCTTAGPAVFTACTAAVYTLGMVMYTGYCSTLTHTLQPAAILTSHPSL
jgi:hypothetical protein